MAHEVIAIERDVERAGRQLVTVDLANRPRNTPCDRHASRANADQSQFFDPAVSVDDFVRDPDESSRHPFRVHHDRHGTPQQQNEPLWKPSVKVGKAERTETFAIDTSSRPHRGALKSDEEIITFEDLRI